MDIKSVTEILTHSPFSQLEALSYSSQGDSYSLFFFFKFTVSFCCEGKMFVRLKEWGKQYIAKLLCAVGKMFLCWELEKSGSQDL